MKKFLSVVFLAMIMLFITACGNSNSKPVPPDPKPSQETSSNVTEKKTDIVQDVPEKHFARKAVLYVIKNEILEPYGDGNFRGDRDITNYEFALGLAKILDDTYKGNLPRGPANPFTDVPASHWAYKPICKLASLKIVEGYGDGSFRGDRVSTRYETALHASNLLSVVAPNKFNSIKSGNPFSDVPESHWAYKSVAKLAMAGVEEGYADGTFRGDRARTRYDAAMLLAKLHSFLKKST